MAWPTGLGHSFRQLFRHSPQLKLGGAATDSPRLALLAALGIGLWLVTSNLPAALLGLWPRLMRVRETDDDGSLDPDREPAMVRIHQGLERLGFRRLGAIELRPPLSRGLPELCYGAPELHSFADLNARGGSLRLTFFTPFEAGEAVVTSNYRRPGRNSSALLLGGLPDHDVGELWAAHRRRVASLAAGPLHPQPWDDISLSGRLRAGERFFAGAGRVELRSGGWIPLTVAAMAALLTASAALQLLRLR